MTGPDDGFEEERQKILRAYENLLVMQELQDIYNRMMKRLEEEARHRLSPSHATILGFIRKADDHLYPSWQHFRPDVERPWQGWAP